MKMGTLYVQGRWRWGAWGWWSGNRGGHQRGVGTVFAFAVKPEALVESSSLWSLERCLEELPRGDPRSLRTPSSIEGHQAELGGLCSRGGEAWQGSMHVAWHGGVQCSMAWHSIMAQRGVTTAEHGVAWC